MTTCAFHECDKPASKFLSVPLTDEASQEALTALLKKMKHPTMVTTKSSQELTFLPSCEEHLQMFAGLLGLSNPLTLSGRMTTRELIMAKALDQFGWVSDYSRIECFSGPAVWQVYIGLETFLHKVLPSKTFHETWVTMSRPQVDDLMIMRASQDSRIDEYCVKEEDLLCVVKVTGLDLKEERFQISSLTFDVLFAAYKAFRSKKAQMTTNSPYKVEIPMSAADLLLKAKTKQEEDQKEKRAHDQSAIDAISVRIVKASNEAALRGLEECTVYFKDIDMNFDVRAAIGDAYNAKGFNLDWQHDRLIIAFSSDRPGQ